MHQAANAFFPHPVNRSVMSQETLRRMIKIENPSGLHMRPVTAFVQRARQFESSVTVTKEAQAVNGKSPLELMLLAAEQGTELILETSGPDALAAMNALAEILSAPRLDDPPEQPPEKPGSDS